MEEMVHIANKLEFECKVSMKRFTISLLQMNTPLEYKMKKNQ